MRHERRGNDHIPLARHQSGQIPVEEVAPLGDDERDTGDRDLLSRHLAGGIAVHHQKATEGEEPPVAAFQELPSVERSVAPTADDDDVSQGGVTLGR